MALTLSIGGSARESILQPDSLIWEDTVNGRSKLKFSLVPQAISGSVVPTDGQEVIFKDGATILFLGLMIQPEEELLPSASLINVRCQVVDYGSRCDARLVVQSYTDQTVGQIVTDILTNFLDGEGITAGTIEAGATLNGTKIYNRKTVSTVFNELAEMSNMAWTVDVDKKLQFRERGTITAPTTLTDQNCFSFTRASVRARYRNRQFVRAGDGLTSSRTESFVGDGTLETFVLKFPIGKAPTATLDTGSGAVAQTIGIKGIDTGRQWYWNKSINTITQDDGGTAIASTNTLAVTYQGLFPILVQADEDVEQVARAAAENSSGLYEHIEQDISIGDITSALDKAQALLSRYTIGDRVVVKTRVTGLFAGQLVQVNVPQLSLIDTFLIEKVVGRDVGGQLLEFWITMLQNDAAQSWMRWYQLLLQQGDIEVDSASESLNLLRKVSDGVVCSDSLAAVTAAPESRVGFAKVGFSEIAA